MRKKLIYIILLIVAILLFFNLNYDVKAMELDSNQEENKMDDTKEKILQYDANTGETTEINMEELEKNFLQSRNEEVLNKIEPYNEKKSDVDIITVNNPYKENSNYNELNSNDIIFYPVDDTSSLPYKAICRITMKDSSGEVQTGTGFIVGPNLILTAAHCVMNQNDSDSIYSEWTAYPGYYPNLDNTDYGYCFGGVSGWSKIIYSSDWHNKYNDWCLCILEKNLGTLIGEWIGCQAYGTNNEMNDLEVRAIGYPKATGNSLLQKYTRGTLSSIADTKFDTSCILVKGMSGGPILRDSDNYAVGIIQGYYTYRPTTGIGVRITQNIINLILENWQE